MRQLSLYKGFWHKNVMKENSSHLADIMIMITGSLKK